ELHHFVTALGVQIGSGLVGEDQVRVFGERPHDCHALLLTVAQALRQRMNAVTEAKRIEEMRRTLHRVRPSVARAVLDYYADVLKCSERLEEVEALVDEADLLPPDGSEVRLVHVCPLATGNILLS